MKNDPPKQTAPPTLEIDYEKYLRFLKHADMTDAEKMDCIRAHWMIVREFVMLGFNIHPVQQAQDACGKRPKDRVEKACAEENAVDCVGQYIFETYNARMTSHDAREREGS